MIIDKLKSALKYILVFLKWSALAVVCGTIGGVIGALFHLSVEWATSFRQSHDFVILFLPLGGVIIAGLYKLFKVDFSTGTNDVIDSVRMERRLPILIAPLIFISTVITHLCGGSAGREGAALQLGGSIGTQIAAVFRLDQKDKHIMVLCGMSGVFSALFGTPLTAAVFAPEVISVGIIYFVAFVPCLISALAGYGISLLFGAAPTKYVLESVPNLSVISVIKVVVLAAALALVSILFCVAIKSAHKYLCKYIKNDFLRAAAGGAVIVALTLLLGTRDYNGAGMEVIQNAINGSALPYAFLLKILFTAITVGSGFRGGEIVPTFFVGATFGCTLAPIIGLDAGFGAAIGIIALFCGVVNCPIASIMLSIELFGSSGLLLFAAAAGVSFILSGYYGLYSSQKIVYSKLKAEYINVNAK